MFAQNPRVGFWLNEGKNHTEGYRSGHNGAVLKTVRAQAHGGSNPSPSARKTAFCGSIPAADILLWGCFFNAGCDKMAHDSVDYAKGETPMTDLQFKEFQRLILREQELLLENSRLKEGANNQSGGNMTDKQFEAYVEMRDERDALKVKLEALYSLVKTKADAGASSQEILEAITRMKDEV